MSLKPNERNEFKMKAFYGTATLIKSIDYLCHQKIKLFDDIDQTASEHHFSRSEILALLNIYYSDIFTINQKMISKVTKAMLKGCSPEKEERLTFKFQEKLNKIEKELLEYSQLDVGSYSSLRIFENEINEFISSFQVKSQVGGQSEKNLRRQKKDRSIRSRSVGRYSISNFKSFNPRANTFNITTNIDFFSDNEDIKEPPRAKRIDVKKRMVDERRIEVGTESDLEVLKKSLSEKEGVYRVRELKGSIHTPKFHDREVKITKKLEIDEDIVEDIRNPKGEEYYKEIREKAKQRERNTFGGGSNNNGRVGKIRLKSLQKPGMNNIFKKITKKSLLVKRKPEKKTERDFNNGFIEDPLTKKKLKKNNVFGVVKVKRTVVPKYLIQPIKINSEDMSENSMNIDSPIALSRKGYSESKEDQDIYEKEVTSRIRSPPFPDIYLKKIEFKRKIHSSNFSPKFLI